MSDEKKSKGDLPATSKELAVYRKPNVRAKSLLERADALMVKNWGKHPKMHAVLNSRVFNGTSIEGTPTADKIAGAVYFRNLAIDDGDTELAAVKLAKLSSMIGTILRRFDFTPLEIE